MKLHILIDTREQLPLWGSSPTNSSATLSEGDYSTKLLHNKVHAERKSPQDLYGSLISNHTRFSAMFKRANEKGVKITLFVECTETYFYSMNWTNFLPQRVKIKTKPETLRKILTTMSQKYQFDIVWCPGRDSMQMWMMQFFRAKEREQYVNMEWTQFLKYAYQNYIPVPAKITTEVTNK